MRRTKRTIAGIASIVMLACSTAALPAQTASAADHNYGEALALSLYFFDSNACGTGITDGPLTWRGDCHTYDGEADVSQAENLSAAAKSILDPDGDGKFDMTGGYHDAGDHVKFNLTIGYSMSSLAMSDYLNDGVYEKAGCMDHFAAVLKRGADYLMKTTVLNASGSVEAICYQVSDLADHSYWTAPEVQDYQRKTYWMSAGNNNTKICGDMINGLAGTAYALRDYDPEYAAKCVKYAKAIYEFGKANKGNEQTGNGGMYGNDSDYQDEFLIAQAWLYLCGAGDQPTTVPNSKQYVSEFGSAYDGYLYSWDKQYQGYAAMMYKMTQNAAYAQELTAEYNDQGGLAVGTYNSRWGWGNSRYNCAVQMTALAIANGDANSSYAQGAKYQMDFLLGDNNLGYSFLIGYGDKWPTHIHHRAANPGENGETSAANPSAKYTNYGMLVGGIDSAGYEDHADRYQYTEGALDYNACFALACAGLYNLYGGDAAAADTVLQNASEINSDYSFKGSGSNVPGTTQPDQTTVTETTTTETSTETTTTETSVGGTTPELKRGDVNASGFVDVADAVLLARYAAQDPTAVISDAGLAAADVTSDGKCNGEDVAMILQYVAKIIPAL